MNKPELAPHSFTSYPLRHGVLESALDSKFPSYLSAWAGGFLSLPREDTHFGYVVSGIATLITEDKHEHEVPAGYCFSAHGPANIDGREGTGVVIARRDWRGFNVITGPIEQEGRLKYIDGCTDSLLISPVRLGDPCLNLLYFPPGIDQTAHTHPSERIGVILSGRGRCHHWTARDISKPLDDDNMVEETVELVPGLIFAIHTDGKHKFSTPHGEPMRVLAYHPESDFGPRDEDHPMINRTIVEGRPASEIAEIRTK